MKVIVTLLLLTSLAAADTVGRVGNVLAMGAYGTLAIVGYSQGQKAAPDAGRVYINVAATAFLVIAIVKGARAALDVD